MINKLEKYQNYFYCKTALVLDEDDNEILQIKESVDINNNNDIEI